MSFFLFSFWVIPFVCPFLFLQINYAFKTQGAQPLFKIKIALYIWRFIYLQENLCFGLFGCRSFFFVQFHCVEQTHKEVIFLLKIEVALYTCSGKKLGQKCSLVFFLWRKFIILNASQAAKQLEWSKSKIPQLWNKSLALSGQKLAKLLDLNLMQLKVSEGYF